MTEQRTHARVDVCLTARWRGTATSQNVRISDLSLGGCYVDTIVEVVAGETMFIQILMPDGRWVEFEGFVAHHFPNLGFGVRFVNLDETRRQEIRAVLGIQNPQPAEASDTFDQSETFSPLGPIDLTSPTIM